MSFHKRNIVTTVILIHLFVFLATGNILDMSKEDQDDGIRQWDRFCEPRDDLEFTKRVSCSEATGKIYFFEPEENMFVGTTNLREICRSKFGYNPGADMVSIMSCQEYQSFIDIVTSFAKRNELKDPVTVYTSGYFSPSLADGGKSGVYRWMKSGKETTEFFENAPECMNWEDKGETTSELPLKLLTIEARESGVKSKFIPWKYPDFSSKGGYLMCELFVPGKRQEPPPEPEPPTPDQPKPEEKPDKSSDPKPGGKTEEDDENPEDIPIDEQESREEIGKFLKGLKDELSKVNAPVIEVTEQLADKLSAPNFSISDPTHLDQVIQLTGEVSEKVDENIPSWEDPLIRRYNFTKRVCKIYADVLQPRNEKAWRPLKQDKRLKDCQSIISRTENLGLKLACEMKDPGNLLIDVNDIGLETFSYDPKTIALKSFIFPSNITTRSERIKNSHILFPKGLNISNIPKACQNPVALGTIHKKLIEKMSTNNVSTPIASDMIAFSFGSEITDIQVDVNLVHSHRKMRGDNPICAFWDTNSLSWNTTGCWVDNYASSLSHTVCRCNHLTNFAVLMDISGRETNSSAKDIISTIGLSLSIICLIVTNFLLLFVPSLKSRRTTITINISFCMLVGNLITLFGLERTENEICCRLISGLMLYSLAALFCWMFLEGYFLYQMIIVVFRGSGYLDTKWLYIIGYGLPVVWTFSGVMIIGLEGLYHPNSYYCWIANPLYPARMWVFAGPIILILFFNMAIFAKSFHVAFISNMNKGSVNRKAGDVPQKNSIIRWFKGWLSLFVLLGLTWLIGFFQFESSSQVASYLFIIMNSFQGVFIFLFEIVTNSKARPAVIKMLSGKLSSEYLRSSKTTNSTNPYSTSNSRTGRSIISNDKKNGIFTNSSRPKMSNSDSMELK
ncbi:adhesion G protein-coupled receptor L3-like [Brevipalpus obovatus]|uniref:adhesion G protein-coupled receptor L3-like n=1 Tax=Brevipalpus obovatus TaxID=246614 RepID=UPI003D9DFA1C